jgi:hypothetical protein
MLSSAAGFSSRKASMQKYSEDQYPLEFRQIRAEPLDVLFILRLTGTTVTFAPEPPFLVLPVQPHLRSFSKQRAGRNSHLIVSCFTFCNSNAHAPDLGVAGKGFGGRGMITYISNSRGSPSLCRLGAQPSQMPCKYPFESLLRDGL